MIKYVYLFNEGNKDMRDLLGGKGANLAEMTNLNINVPKGFTVTTEVCKYYNEKKKVTVEMKRQIENAIKKLEKQVSKEFGNKENPLLLSVRSGAKISMPGMMDSILNIGMNDEIASELEKKVNPRFVYDSYRRLIQMFSDVVMGFDRNQFEEVITRFKTKKGVKFDVELDATDLKNITNEYKRIYKRLSGREFPNDVYEQLFKTIYAVFDSWNNDRAISYRRMNNIDDALGTAVNVQQMVYGNYNEKSGTGVAFSRNPSTGENEIFGEFLLNAQGEDVVAGVRTPEKISELKKFSLSIYEEFKNIAKKLESHYKDMQDMEFTIEDNKLYILQTRNGKRTGTAAINIAVDLVNEGLISKEEAILRIEKEDVESALHKRFDVKEDDENLLTTGINASPGASCGKIYFNSKDAVDAKNKGEEVILVRKETSPEDIAGMKEADGLLTATGGMTSHAAVVMRGMGKCCVCGASDIEIDEENKTISFNDVMLMEGDYISLDGSNGNVYLGKLNTLDPEINEKFEEFLSYAKEIKDLDVYVNSDTEKDLCLALKFGAEGVGLVRTEHMFFEKNRIKSFRKMILAETKEEKDKWIKVLEKYQEEDFISMFNLLDNKTITIRYLDPPLHEFLPKDDETIFDLSTSLNINMDELKTRINNLKEFNPMMGNRGVRLLITRPEIIKMQTRAIINAYKEVNKNIELDLMIPLISDINELKYVKNIIKEEIDKIDSEINYKIGTMIETPRSALTSHKLAKEADFYSFGSNDLTQFTFGFSRDDANFLNTYYKDNIFTSSPFNSLDIDGVGMLMLYAKTASKKVNKDIKIGICGEQAADESAIDFCNNIGLNYISVSSYRVPLAILLSAKAKLNE